MFILVVLNTYFKYFFTITYYSVKVIYYSTTIKDNFIFILFHNNIILISNLTILNDSMQIHTVILNIQNVQLKTIISNKNC